MLQEEKTRKKLRSGAKKRNSMKRIINILTTFLGSILFFNIIKDGMNTKINNKDDV